MKLEYRLKLEDIVEATVAQTRPDVIVYALICYGILLSIYLIYGWSKGSLYFQEIFLATLLFYLHLIIGFSLMICLLYLSMYFRVKKDWAVDLNRQTRAMSK